MLDIITGSVRTLFRKRGRTILTLLGIIIGTASVILINNISSLGNSAFVNEVNSLGMGGLAVTLKKQSAQLTHNELEEIRALPFVENAMPLMFESTDAYIRGKKSPVFLWGIDKGAKETVDLRRLNGRFLNSGDISSSSKALITS